MVALLDARLSQCGAHRSISGDERLTRVQRLSTHLARMVDAHEPCDVTPIFNSERAVRTARTRVLAGRHCSTAQGAQRLVSSTKHAIHESKHECPVVNDQRMK